MVATSIAVHECDATMLKQNTPAWHQKKLPAKALISGIRLIYMFL